MPAAAIYVCSIKPEQHMTDGLLGTPNGSRGASYAPVPYLPQASPFILEDGEQQGVAPGSFGVEVLDKVGFLSHARFLQYSRRPDVVRVTLADDAMQVQLLESKLDQSLA